MAEEAAEKQHQATGKRIDELRKKGQTMRSKDLTSGLVFMVAVASVIYMAQQIKTRIVDNFILSFTNIHIVMDAKDFPGSLLHRIAVENFLVLLPIFAAIVVAALLSPFVFGGWNFSWQSIRFKPETFNPVSNLQNLFSKRIFGNIVKSMLKVAVILGVLAIFAYNKKEAIAGMVNLTFNNATNLSFAIVYEFTITISAALILIILYDVISNYFEYTQKIKMTSQELKEEHKEMEGNTDVKRKVRSRQMALLKQRLSLTVPKAHVIITNPTHYAVAIRYDDGKDKAPRVVAKGKDHIATQIRRLAAANAIPIYQAPPLARAIYKTSKIGAEINPGLYMAVAIVLSYVHQLKNYQQGVGKEPMYISDLKIPPELIYND